MRKAYNLVFAGSVKRKITTVALGLRKVTSFKGVICVRLNVADTHA